MKKVIAIIAVVALFLCGCTKDTHEGLSITVPEGAVLFEDVMGLKGYYLDEKAEASEWYTRYYHADIDGKDVGIGESFGFGEAQDFLVDIDDDEIKELICNCTFGGDGATRVYAYRLNNGVPEVGVLDEDALAEGYTGPYSAIQEEYLPDDECIFFAYPGKEGNMIDCYFSTDEFVWSPYEPFVE